VRRADNLTAFMCRLLKSGSLILLEPSGTFQACNGISSQAQLPESKCVLRKSEESKMRVDVSQLHGSTWIRVVVWRLSTVHAALLARPLCIDPGGKLHFTTCLCEASPQRYETWFVNGGAVPSKRPYSPWARVGTTVVFLDDVYIDFVRMHFNARIKLHY